MDLVVIKSLCVFHYGVAAFGGMANLLFPLSISSSLDQSLPHTHKSQNPTITVWSTMGRAHRNPYSWWQPVLSLAFTSSCVFPSRFYASPSLFCTFLAICWPDLHSGSWTSSLTSSSVNLFLPTFQEFFLARYENHNYHICQILSASSLCAFSLKISRQYVMLHFLSPPPPPLFPPKHNFPSSSPMPPVLC